VRHDEPAPSSFPEPAHSYARTARRLRSALLILPVLTRILPKLNRLRRDLAHETPELSGGTDYTDRDGSEHEPPEAPKARWENTETDAVPDSSDPARPIHDSVIPLDSAPEPIKKTHERRRRRQRAFPEPPVPTFVMVGPGRFVRAEEPAPSYVATLAESEGDNPVPGTSVDARFLDGNDANG
jgi:hypothetical protein